MRLQAKNQVTSLIALAMFVVVASGCMSFSTTVRGRVMKGSTPVEGATVEFGPTLAVQTATTGADGRFELTARHGPIQMLRLTAKKQNMVQREKIEFPGFAAPDSEVEIDMIGVIGRQEK